MNKLQKLALSGLAPVVTISAMGAASAPVVHHAPSSSQPVAASDHFLYNGLDQSSGVQGIPLAWVPLSGAQRTNAKIIIRVVKARHLSKKAAAITLSAGLMESRLINVHYGNADSLGLFQQRPSMGWGSAAQILNRWHATNAFLNALVRVPGWSHMSIWRAAYAVQRCAPQFAYTYQYYAHEAWYLVHQYWGHYRAHRHAHTTAKVSGGRYYRIRPGDTLSAIARRFHTSVRRLAALNHIRNVNLIYAGHTIRVR